VGDSSAPAQKSSAIDRIQRLERLESQRLAEKAEKSERRQQQVADAKPSGGRHDLVDRIEDLTKYPLTVLGVAWLVLAIIVTTTTLSGPAPTVLVTVLFILWAITLVEYVVRLLVTPDSRGYVSRRRIEPVTVVLPIFQGWHLIGMEKVNLLVIEGVLRVEAILKHRSLFRVLIAAAGLLFLGAWLVMLFESRSKAANIHDYQNALWWAIVTVTTVGYGDKFPVTGGGRAVAVVLMLVGIGLIGILTATVASFFMQEHTDANRQQLQQSHADLGQQLTLIMARLDGIEGQLRPVESTSGSTTPTVPPDQASPS
jgi:voltage-gated potassium channel